MNLIYNIEFVNEAWIFKQGDTVNLSRKITRYDPTSGTYVAFDMTGMTIDIWVRRLDGLILKKWTTTGTSPTITIATDTFTVYDTGFTESGHFKADVQITDGSDIQTIEELDVWVKKEYTG